MYEIFALEKRYDIALKGKHIKKMTGIVDKIMAYQDQFVVVDYKSSDRMIHLKEYEYGLQSQLPFYMNIVEKHSDLNLKPSGFFYHPFTMKLPKNDGKTTPAEQEKKAWQMKGYIDPDQVSYFDPHYDTHSFIKGMNVKKDGTFYKSAQLLTKDELKALGDWMELKVDEAIQHMEEGSFKINPKGTMNNSPSCQYCQFKDICFKTKDDYQPFTYKDDEAFLSMLVGGQDDSN
jgi:ATP-dependent helicase/nuclease subunit B